MAKWITDWYTSDYTKLGYGSTAQNYLGWTDEPDSTYRDWCNHMYDVHNGYLGGTPERCAPDRIQQLYGWLVTNLTNWIKSGMPTGSTDEKNSAKTAGVMTHYFGDLSQVMHTDETVSGGPKHDHPTDDPRDRTYHGYYDSASIGDIFLNQLRLDLNAYTFQVNVKITNPKQQAIDFALWVNAHDGATAIASDGSTVGSTYWSMLSAFKANYDTGTTYLGARGYSQPLYQDTVVNIRNVVGNLTRLFYSTFKDAEANAGGGGGTTYLTDVGIIEVYYDTSGVDSDEEYVLLYNPKNVAVDISGWTMSDGERTGTFPAGTIISSKVILFVRDTASKLGADIKIDFSNGLANTGDSVTLKQSTTIKDAVCWEAESVTGCGTPHPGVSTGKTLERKSDATGYIDTNDSAADFIVGSPNLFAAFVGANVSLEVLSTNGPVTTDSTNVAAFNYKSAKKAKVLDVTGANLSYDSAANIVTTMFFTGQ